MAFCPCVSCVSDGGMLRRPAQLQRTKHGTPSIAVYLGHSRCSRAVPGLFKGLFQFCLLQVQGIGHIPDWLGLGLDRVARPRLQDTVRALQGNYIACKQHNIMILKYV